MAPHLSKDLRDRVVKWQTYHGYTYRKLADLAGGAIANILTYHNHHGTSVNPFRYYPGRPRLLDDTKVQDEKRSRHVVLISKVMLHSQQAKK